MPPSSSASSKSKRIRRRPLLLMVGLLLVAGGAGVGYLVWNRGQEADFAGLLADFVKRFGPRATLDESRYIDTDGDLLADPPNNPADLRDPPEILFTGLVLDDPETELPLWEPLREHLARSLGRPVKYLEDLGGMEAQLQALREGRLHVTAFSTGGVPAAVNAAGFIPVCVPADAAGSFAYQMEIIVPADSPIKTPADLRGKHFTFSNLASNAGMKAPVFLLFEQFNLRLGKDYTFHFSGSYRESLRGIASGKFQAASVANDFLKREVAHGTLRRDQYRTIFQSADFPPFCFGHAHNLGPELAGKIRQALTAFSWQGTAVEKEFGPAGLTQFVPVNYRQAWALVRAVDQGILQLARAGR